ncbi:MAG TPA: DUF5995 family protein [Patescibacteria group bacterium]|nr:DUF5995 family protein [Patescibacteria group bacterium]
MIKTLRVKKFSETVPALKGLEKKLGETKLKNILPFNTAYLIISRNVEKREKDNYFENPDLLKKLDVNFVNYYLSAINDYENGDNVAPLWKIAFESKNINPLINLSLGANAHINNDLPLSLAETIDDKKFYRDYQKAGTVIFESLDEILDSIHKDKPNAFLRFYYKLVMKYLIKRWRKSAWKKWNNLFYS